jgi:hypothetical protein
MVKARLCPRVTLKRRGPGPARPGSCRENYRAGSSVRCHKNTKNETSTAPNGSDNAAHPFVLRAPAPQHLWSNRECRDQLRPTVVPQEDCLVGLRLTQIRYVIGLDHRGDRLYISAYCLPAWRRDQTGRSTIPLGPPVSRGGTRRCKFMGRLWGSGRLRPAFPPPDTRYGKEVSGSR